jgi:hypothetical protein
MQTPIQQLKNSISLARRIAANDTLDYEDMDALRRTLIDASAELEAIELDALPEVDEVWA